MKRPYTEGHLREVLAAYAINTCTETRDAIVGDLLESIDLSLTQAARAQMERDCAAVCEWCSDGAPATLNAPGRLWPWVHLNTKRGDKICIGGPIRTAWAEDHPESGEQSPQESPSQPRRNVE